jgi:hypothetical protein
VWWCPGGRCATVDQPVSIRDAATITQSLGLADAGVFGTSLPVARRRRRGSAPAPGAHHTALRRAPRRRIVREPLFLFRKGSEPGKPTEFYDLSSDPLTKRALPPDARSAALLAHMDAQLPPAPKP